MYSKHFLSKRFDSCLLTRKNCCNKVSFLRLKKLIIRYVKNSDVFKLLVKKKYIEQTKFMKRGQWRTDSLNKKVKIEKVCAVPKRLLKCRVWPLKVWNIILLFCSSDFCLWGSECLRCSFLFGAPRFQLTRSVVK